MNKYALCLFVPIVTSALIACGGSVSVESKPAVRQAVKVESSPGNAITSIEEICYNGIVYLVNGRGGMAPKMVTTGNETDDAAHAWVAKCK